MITEIKAIHGIGRYSKCDISVPLKKNQVVFGFNGTGKSTLSDIFYSMSSAKNSLLNDRKTLPLADETQPQDIFVSFGTDSGVASYTNGVWNNADNAYVFNDHYIEEYLFVEENHSIENGTFLEKKGLFLLKRNSIYNKNLKLTSNKSMLLFWLVGNCVEILR